MPARPRRCAPRAMLSSTLALRQQLDVLERARKAPAGDEARRPGRGCRCPSRRMRAGVGRQGAADQVEHRAFAGAVGPDQRDDLAGVHRQVDRRAPRPGRRSASPAPMASSTSAPRRRHRRGAAAAAALARHRGRPTAGSRNSSGSDAARGVLQQQDDGQAERHRLEIAGGAQQAGQQVVQLVAQQHDDGRADQRAGQMGRRRR